MFPTAVFKKTACNNFSTNKSVAPIAVLYFISFSVFAVEPGEDKLGIYLVFNYEFQSSATGRGSFGFGFDMENQKSVFQKHDSPGINTMHFSCVGCTDEEFKRAAAIYGLILLAGYGLANELAE